MSESPKSPEWSKNISFLCKTTLDLPPSCLEFVPAPSSSSSVPPHLRDYYHEYFVVGTYCLEKDESAEIPEAGNEDDGEQLVVEAKLQSKNGSLILFRYHDEKLQIIQTLPHPSAVFDLHFLPHSPLFAIVSSDGTVSIFTIASSESPNDPVPSIQHVITHQVFTNGISPTFFSWSPSSHQTMAITTSDGGVYLVHFSSDYSSFRLLNNGEPVVTHTEYAWCCAFTSSPSLVNRLYSGGDDNKLRLENLGFVLINCNPEDEIEASGLWTKGIPGHEAGVTFILPLPLTVPISGEDGQEEGEREQLLLTGSYDDYIRILSIPSYPSRPKVLTELHLGGGVWRLKFLDPPSSLQPLQAEGNKSEEVKYRVLASCMHAGAKILSVVGTRRDGEWSWKIEILAEMSLHKSMNYASDVQDLQETESGNKLIEKERSRVCVSSSFYDRLLCVWRWDPEMEM